MFHLTRIYSDSNGDSHFQDVNIPLVDSGKIGALSHPVPAVGIIFREVEPVYDYDLHVAPQRQYLILLDGEIEIETSLGDKKIFRTGEVLLLEDTTGKGHKTRNLKKQKRRSVFITLP